MAEPRTTEEKREDLWKGVEVLDHVTEGGYVGYKYSKGDTHASRTFLKLKDKDGQIVHVMLNGQPQPEKDVGKWARGNLMQPSAAFKAMTQAKDHLKSLSPAAQQDWRETISHYGQLTSGKMAEMEKWWPLQWKFHPHLKTLASDAFAASKFAGK